VVEWNVQFMDKDGNNRLDRDELKTVRLIGSYLEFGWFIWFIWLVYLVGLFGWFILLVYFVGLFCWFILLVYFVGLVGPVALYCGAVGVFYCRFIMVFLWFYHGFG
jgi:hypothetical protein